MTRIAGFWRRGSAILLVLSAFVVSAMSAAPARAAVSPQDAQNISLLRSMFGVNGSDSELAQLLDSSKIGPSIVGNIDCAWFGEHALDRTTNGAMILSPLTQELTQVESADQFVENLVTSDLENLLPDDASACSTRIRSSTTSHRTCRRISTFSGRHIARASTSPRSRTTTATGTATATIRRPRRA